MFERLKTRYVQWQGYRQAVRQLEWLDRRLLADTGIEFKNIRSCAKASAEGKCD
jgi:uncharacterized protein YjiS (DUF1127 family)